MSSTQRNWTQCGDSVDLSVQDVRLQLWLSMALKRPLRKGSTRTLSVGVPTLQRLAYKWFPMNLITDSGFQIKDEIAQSIIRRNIIKSLVIRDQTEWCNLGEHTSQRQSTHGSVLLSVATGGIVRECLCPRRKLVNDQSSSVKVRNESYDACSIIEIVVHLHNVCHSVPG